MGWPACAAAFAVFAAALGTTFEGFWGADLRTDVPFPRAMLASGARGEPAAPPLLRADYRLAAWGVGRNAWTLVHRPASLYNAEPCHPVENALALHHPLLTPALLALPASVAIGEPVAALNAVLLAKPLIEALAMFALVADWTRSAPAATVAGLLYAFHPTQTGSPHHFFTTDNAWWLLALLFARRLFERGRWRDAAGLGACCGLQMGSSFYPFFAALVAALPLGAWLLWHYRRPPPPRALLAAGLAALAAWVVFAPYLARSGMDEVRGLVHYATWSGWLPGGAHFVGMTGAALVAAAFVLGRDRALPGLRGDPRLALALAALAVAFVAAGGNHVARMVGLATGEPPLVALPNPFAMLARLLPGLAAVRIPAAIGAGARQILCLLAGLGAAALLARVPRRAAAPLAIALVALAFLETSPPAFLRSGGEPLFAPLRLRPDAATLDFYRALEARGNHGPLFEVPMDYSHTGFVFNEASGEHLLSAYHHRRTSGCFSSFIPAEVRGLDAYWRGLSDPVSLDALRELGFTTVVVRHGGGPFRERSAQARVRAAAEASGGRLVPVLSGEELSAWALGAAVVQ